MKVVWFLIGYISISAVLYIALRAKCRTDAVFRVPSNIVLYYVLSFTWGLPMTLIGGIAAAVLRLKGFKPTRFCRSWCFEIPGINWGVSLGVVFIAPKGNYEKLKAHEFGHAVQNVYLGWFTPAVVSIPSVIRFWYRAFREKIGKPCEAEYDDVWFEKSATMSGLQFVNIWSR